MLSEGQTGQGEMFKGVAGEDIGWHLQVAAMMLLSGVYAGVHDLLNGRMVEEGTSHQLQMRRPQGVEANTQWLDTVSVCCMGCGRGLSRGRSVTGAGDFPRKMRKWSESSNAARDCFCTNGQD